MGCLHFQGVVELIVSTSAAVLSWHLNELALINGEFNGLGNVTSKLLAQTGIHTFVGMIDTVQRTKYSPTTHTLQRGSLTKCTIKARRISSDSVNLHLSKALSLSPYNIFQRACVFWNYCRRNDAKRPTSAQNASLPQPNPQRHVYNGAFSPLCTLEFTCSGSYAPALLRS